MEWIRCALNELGAAFAVRPPMQVEYLRKLIALQRYRDALNSVKQDMGLEMRHCLIVKDLPVGLSARIYYSADLASLSKEKIKRKECVVSLSEDHPA